MPMVLSTAISRIQYDPGSRTLRVTFRDSGRTYTYDGVPESVYQDFLRAPSRGRFFNEAVKDRYRATRVGRGTATRV